MLSVGDLVLDCWSWGSVPDCLYIIVEIIEKPYNGHMIYRLLRVNDPTHELFLSEDIVQRMKSELAKRVNTKVFKRELS